MSETVAARGGKDRDYWWTVLVVDPIAFPLARFLARKRWLTADQVTSLALLVGAASGFAYASEGRIGLALGAALFFTSFVLDCVDGKVARALGTSSPRGQVLDELADAGRRTSAAVGLAVHLWDDGGASFWWAIAYALLAFLFAALSGGTRGEPATAVGGRWSQRLARRRLLPTPGTPDVGALVFIFGPLTGWIAPAFAVGSALISIGTMIVVWRRFRDSGGVEASP
ncbi:MAG: CDP-alcohol phosphatidyltransferase family protein [Actinomycetota bacterium]